MLAVRRWRSSHLLLAWATYWLLLVAVTLGHAIAAAWRASQSAPGHASIDAGFNDALVHLRVVQDGATTWSGAATLGEIAFWMAVPPLLMWLVWLMSRPRANHVAAVPTDEAASRIADGERPALGAPDEGWPGTAARREAERVRRTDVPRGD